MSMRGWLESGAHLPAFLRDFHEQKSVFKYVHSRIREGDKERMPSWLSAHIYVIDAFLWVMAAHGWTLQRCRAKQDFGDLDESIAAMREEERASLKAMLDGGAR